MRPLRELYQQYTKYLKSRNNVLNKYMLQVIEYCALFINDKNKDKVKRIKTIEEIEKEKEKDVQEVKEKREGDDEEVKNEIEEGESNDDNKKEEDALSEEKEKSPSKRKAIKLKIHKKKKEVKEGKEEDGPSVEEEKRIDKKKDATPTVRSLPAAVQAYIDETTSFQNNCKDAIDNYAYDLERNSDLFSGTLGQTMKLSSEVYQMVSREMYYNSTSTSYYLDPYQFPDNEGDSVSLYTRVNNIKSDIRRLKGMLLNHRNFPKYKQRALANTTSSFSSS